METTDPRAELEGLQRALSARESTPLFVHAAVSLMVALIFSGAAAKLFWDSVRMPYLGVLAAAVSLGLAAYGVKRYLQGRRVLREELAQYQRLQDLRRTLGLDDPAALLPRA